MIRRLFQMVNQRWQGMHEAAILLGVFSLVSQLLGLVRDRMLANTIGPSPTLDVYYAAFRIPDLIYLSIASLASITVLMPFLIERLDSDGKESARAFFNDVLSGFLLLLFIVSAGVFLLMPKIAHYIAPGFSPENITKLVSVSRIMLISPICMGLSNMLGTVTQLLRKFFIFSLSPIFYNIGLIIGITFFYPRFGVYGLAWGVALGALLHLLVQVPTIFSAGFTPKVSRKLGRSTLRQVVTLSLPRTLGLSMNSIALLVIVSLASTLGVGAISIFNFSINLETVPVGIIGLSYAVASFPLLSETFSRGEKDRWQECILSALRQIVFWSLPLTSLFIVLRAQIVRVTLGTGAFSWADTRLTAAAIAIFSIALIAQNAVLVSVRAFYSAHNTKTPLMINAFCSLFIIGGGFSLVYIFKTVPVFRYFIESLLRVEDTPGTAMLMLPLAYAIGTLLNAWLHFVDLRKQYLTNIGTLKKTFFQSIAAAFGMGVVAYFVLNLLAPVFSMHTFWGVAMQGFFAGIAGIIAGIIILYFLGSEPLFEFLSAVRKKFWKVDLVTSEETPQSK
jgi:putative peptidoglycan lipid II flippase